MKQRRIHNLHALLCLLLLVFSGKSHATEAPTSLPTISARPSSSPSTEPSNQPSLHPISTPSSFPSTMPSSSPSLSPSSYPTPTPSVSLSPTPVPSSSTPTETSRPSSLPSTFEELPLVPTTNNDVSSEPTVAPTLPPAATGGEFPTTSLYLIYGFALIIVVGGTLVYCCRNFGENFSFAQYSPLNTSDDSHLFPRSAGSNRQQQQNPRDIELARFERMAGSMSSYPNPSSGSSNSGNNNNRGSGSNRQ